MLFRKLEVLLFCVALLPAVRNHALADGHEVGDHGDPVMIIFDKAAFDAAVIVDEVQNDQQLIRLDMWQWFVQHRAQMKADLLQSKHVWFLDESELLTCATTNSPLHPRQTILLSLPKCRQIIQQPGNGETLAIKMLIHEAGHQQGLNESYEDFLNELADKLYQSWKSSRERRQPFWATISIPKFEFSERTRPATANLDSLGVRGVQKLAIWGGCHKPELPSPGSCSAYLDTGAIFEYDKQDPRHGQWVEMSKTGVSPTARADATAVWMSLQGATDPEPLAGVITFGGCSGLNAACSEAYNDAYFYEVLNKSWHRLPDLKLFAKNTRIGHTAVWGQGRMFVWGGVTAKTGEGSAVPVPSSESAMLIAKKTAEGGLQFSWEQLVPKLSVPFASRFNHFSVWTGSSLIVWGGCGAQSLGRCRQPLMDGLVYTPNFEKPELDQWEYIPPPGFLVAREQSSVTWNGTQLLIWGGKNFSKVYGDGALFDTRQNIRKWSPISTVTPSGGQAARFKHSAVWDGTRQRLLIWGGKISTDTGTNAFADRLIAVDFSQESSAGEWSEINMKNVPTSTIDSAVSSGLDLFLTWGGFSRQETFTREGFIFFP